MKIFLLFNLGILMDDELSQYIKILQNVTSGDNKIMQATYDYISSIPQNKILELSCKTILLGESVPIICAKMSFILINRIRPFISSNWENIKLDKREIIKDAVIRGIRSSDATIMNYASAIFAFIAEADKQYLDIIQIVTTDIINQEIPNQNKIGFVFAMKELIQLRVISSGTKNYQFSFPVFIQYLIYILTYPREFPKSIFIAAISCYKTIFPFYGKLINTPKNSQTKTLLISLINSILENELDFELQNVLYQFLFTFFQTCYKFIDQNIESIFQITKTSFSRPNAELLIPSICFWNEVANYEYQLTKEKERNIVLSIEDDIVMQNITEKVSQVLLVPIVEFIIQTSNEKPPDECAGEANFCHDAAEALLSFGRLSLYVFNFVTNNFRQMSTNADWKVRHASLILLYCITESSNIHDQIEFLSTNFISIISMVNDQSYAVDDAALWIINIIFNKYQSIATDENFLNLLQVIINNAPYAPLILTTRICDIVNILGKNFKGIKDNSGSYEKAFPSIMESMLKTLERDDSPNTILGSHCSEGLSSLILAAPKTLEPSIYQVLHQMNDRIHAEITRQDIVPHEYIQMKIQFYCVIIYSCVKRLQSKIEPYYETIMQTLLSLLSKKSVICQQEGLITLSALIDVLGEKIHPYIEQIVQIFYISQESHVKEIIEMSSSVIYSLFNTLGMSMATDEERNQKIVNIFIQNLNDQDLDISAKVQILFAMAEMIKVLKLVISPAYPIFVQQLTNFQSLLYNDQLDGANTCMLCIALLEGYSSLILSSAGSEYEDVIVSNYRQITRLFEIMNRFPNMTPRLKSEIIDYLNVVLRTISSKVNFQLNKKCVKSIVQKITVDEDMELSLRASHVLKEIKYC